MEQDFRERQAEVNEVQASKAKAKAETLAFPHAPEPVRPARPDGTAQQAHLDFDVPDLDAAERQILAIGATKAETQPQPEDWRVYLDPAGHPFCLVLEDEGTAEGTA